MSQFTEVNGSELQQVEGGVVQLGAIVGAVAIGAGAAIAVTGVGLLAGYALYELIY